MSRNIDLLHERILPAMSRLALPIMATSLVQMAYNLTDMAWIGRLGAGAVTAVGTAGMYMWLSQGFIDLAKIGGQVKVAQALGAGDEKDAGQFAKTAIQLGLLCSLIIGLLAFFQSHSLIRFFGLRDSWIIENAETYLKITGGGIVFSYMNAVLTGLFTASGDSRTPLKANAAGLVVNMVLDPVLIFGLGFFPVMGVTGAAVATVAAQMVVTVIFILSALRERLVFDKFFLFSLPSARHIREIVRIGFPTSIQNIIYSSISMVLTRLVTGFGDTAVAIQRVGGQVESISWMTAEGFAAALNSFTGQNFGAKQYQRVKKGYSTAVGMMILWGALTTCILVFLAVPIFRIFIQEEGVLHEGSQYLKILGYSQIFMCVELLTIGAFAGLGKTLIPSVLSIILTSMRIPLALVLSATSLGLDGIWWAITISSVVKGIIFFLSCRLLLRRLPPEKEDRAVHAAEDAN